MPGVPFLGRLFIREYTALIASFILVALEAIIRIITLALPDRLIEFFYDLSRRAFNRLSSEQGRKARAAQRAVVAPIAQAQDFVDLCGLFGYSAEEHVIQTEDGYFLGLHRLARRKGEEDQHVNAGPGSVQKKVVYLHHGLFMNSEVWVCLTEKERALPLMLVEAGYDVWLGNNRGNKYSKKSIHSSPASLKFWDFSIDEFALHDIPDTLSYILDTTKRGSLSYIGFSQGTAQAFATLAIHPKLNEKVDVFIALAPAMSPPGLSNGIVSSLIKASPEVLYLLFGRKSLLSSATTWQSLLYPPIFVRFIDDPIRILFNWQTKNIQQNQKLAAYPHLFSFTSTKCVVHWFQIIRNGTFQMFDDEVQGLLQVSQGRRFYKPAKYPTKNIRTPIVLVYGGSDSLVDINVMLKELPKHTIAKEIPHYEHLDFLWASDVDKLVHPHVFDALDLHARSTESKETSARHSRPNSVSLQPLSYSGEENAGGSGNDGHSSVPSTPVSSSADRRYSWATSTDSPQPASSTHSRNALHQRSSNSSLREGRKISPAGIAVGTSKATSGLVNGSSGGAVRR